MQAHSHRSAIHNLHPRGGFTLVEILAVVVILGIASAIIIPQIGTRDDLVASAAARVVMADLIYAQNRAIAMQKKHFVQFVGQQYTLMTRASDTSPLTAITHPVDKTDYVTAFGVRYSGLENASLGTINFGGPSIIGFDELGSPFSFDPATGIIAPLTSPATIQVCCGSHRLTIAIEPFTGETTVQ
ncbi:pilus assembly FimT family protein [Fontivita pretiosa]|uniref:pilus assembly FimT family protein n=1 Tax=Fontivita pretiosa TaxID=2989684 RepID=UPI003D186B41